MFGRANQTYLVVILQILEGPTPPCPSLVPLVIGMYPSIPQIDTSILLKSKLFYFLFLKYSMTCLYESLNSEGFLIKRIQVLSWFNPIPNSISRSTHYQIGMGDNLRVWCIIESSTILFTLRKSGCVLHFRVEDMSHVLRVSSPTKSNEVNNLYIYYK